ncbi:MAG: hypothetical protein V4589_05595 [Bacteroidota bacterium]
MNNNKDEPVENIIVKKKVGRPKKNPDQIIVKKTVGRPRVSDEEKKQRKYAYDVEYQRNKYYSDEQYRERRLGYSHNQYAQAKLTMY